MIERILSKCVEEGDCLEWQGRMNNRVPKTYMDGMDRPVRRVLWESVNGPIKPGWFATCGCGNHRCVKLDHIRLMTPKMMGKKAARSGVFASPQRRAAIAATRRKNSKLTPEQVQQVREAVSGAQAARDLGISKSMASKIRRGDAWADHMRGASVFGWRP